MPCNFIHNIFSITFLQQTMHTLHSIPKLSKSESYESLLPQLEMLIRSDSDLFVSNLANVSAVLKETFGWFWVGFYLVDKSQENLILNAFQGTLACTRIAKGRGVCGQSWAKNRVMIVPNVHEHPDHIACSSLSQSEIVLPLYNQHGQIIGVLDVDDTELAKFDETDAHYLSQICALLTRELNVPEMCQPIEAAI